MSQAAVDQFRQTLLEALLTVRPVVEIDELKLFELMADQHAQVKKYIEDKLKWPAFTLGYPEGCGGWDLVEGGYLCVHYKPGQHGMMIWRESDET